MSRFIKELKSQCLSRSKNVRLKRPIIKSLSEDSTGITIPPKNSNCYELNKPEVLNYHEIEEIHYRLKIPKKIVSEVYDDEDFIHHSEILLNAMEYKLENSGAVKGRIIFITPQNEPAVFETEDGEYYEIRATGVQIVE